MAILLAAQRSTAVCQQPRFSASPLRFWDRFLEQDPLQVSPSTSSSHRWDSEKCSAKQDCRVNGHLLHHLYLDVSLCVCVLTWWGTFTSYFNSGMSVIKFVLSLVFLRDLAVWLLGHLSRYNSQGCMKWNWMWSSSSAVMLTGGKSTTPINHCLLTSSYSWQRQFFDNWNRTHTSVWLETS